MRESAWAKLTLWDGRDYLIDSLTELTVDENIMGGAYIEIEAGKIREVITQNKKGERKMKAEKLKNEIYKLDRYEKPNNFPTGVGFRTKASAGMISLEEVIKIIDEADLDGENKKISEIDAREIKQKWEVLKARADMIKDAIGDVEEYIEGENIKWD